jgi:hypothetical protein
VDFRPALACSGGSHGFVCRLPSKPHETPSLHATLSPRSVFDRYAARVSRARELYRQACEESADLPLVQRTWAEAVAFTALKSAQQDAMREFSASEFAELLNLRQSISAPKR